MTEVSRKPLIVDIIPECREGFNIVTIDDCILLFKEMGPKLAYGLARLLHYKGQIVGIHGLLT